MVADVLFKDVGHHRGSARNRTSHRQVARTQHHEKARNCQPDGVDNPIPGGERSPSWSPQAPMSEEPSGGSLQLRETTFRTANHTHHTGGSHEQTSISLSTSLKPENPAGRIRLRSAPGEAVDHPCGTLGSRSGYPLINLGRDGLSQSRRFGLERLRILERQLRRNLCHRCDPIYLSDALSGTKDVLPRLVLTMRIGEINLPRLRKLLGGIAHLV